MCLQLGNAIICGARGIQFCYCCRQAQYLCDWKVTGNKSGTCDKPLCANHAHEVGRNKHLCAEHRNAFECWKRRHDVMNLQDYRARIAGQAVLMFPEAEEAKSCGA